ncbi:putative ribonuclease H protein At1g65750 isoform X1 [Apium graveolens]|uniref:putative ribonuclease H protein At1g65750 isoform X1 n=1 Tax=Apium graveolens TaxID=4045 RepID=UPI003D79C545
MMRRFKFPDVWVERVMQCIKTVTYSFLRNGEIFGEVIPQRGIRQGDPISPYLYILCAEGLSAMIREYEKCGLLHGCKIARNAPSISHLLFADNCYFFLRATKTEAQTLKSVLQRYEAWSGQVISYEKSEVVFSPNTLEENCRAVCESLSVKQVQKPGKYLGMPMCVGNKKTEVFGFLTVRVQQRLEGWYNKELSKHGKVTLLSSAAQTIPSFWMSLFQIPVTICEDIERKMNAFLWGSGGNSKGVKWMSWRRVCKPKSCGGLGLRELRDFNLSMLAKQGWRLLTESNPLVSAVMKAKYYPNSSFLDATIGSNPSFAWRSILAAIDVVKAGARRRIGNGRDTTIWDSPWLPDVSDGYVRTPMPEQLHHGMVHNLMQEDVCRWDFDIVQDVLQTRDVDLIKRIPLPLEEVTDSWFWILDEKGDYTVKSGYRWLQGELDMVDKGFWIKLWSLKLPGKVTNFLWRVCTSCLPTASALILKHVDINVLCPWCHSASETDTHVLFECGFAKTVWNMTGIFSSVQYSVNNSAGMVIRHMFENCSREQCVQVGMVCWSLWNRRNKWVWEKINGSAFGVKAAANNLLRDWREAQITVEKDQKAAGARQWENPDAGWIKVNVDAAIFQDNSIGCGAVIRDHQGVFLAARCKKVDGVWRPREAEAIALKEALSWIMELQYKECIFETDSKTLVQACNREPEESFFGTIVGDCTHLLKHINSVLIRFVFRSANRVARTVAKSAYSMSDNGESGLSLLLVLSLMY